MVVSPTKVQRQRPRSGGDHKPRSGLSSAIHGLYYWWEIALLLFNFLSSIFSSSANYLLHSLLGCRNCILNFRISHFFPTTARSGDLRTKFVKCKSFDGLFRAGMRHVLKCPDGGITGEKVRNKILYLILIRFAKKVIMCRFSKL